MRLHRIAPGVYEAPGAHRIVRTVWEGPRGGKRYRWEIATLEQGNWTVGRSAMFPTKREAAEYLCQLIETAAALGDA